MNPVEPWLTSTPPRHLASALVELVPPTTDDIDPLVVAVNESLPALRLWMPWAQAQATASSMAAFVSTATEGWERGTDFDYVIHHPVTGSILGCCGLHARLGAGALEIGYWVHSAHTGSGIATAAAELLSTAALETDGVHHVQIRCDVANVASARIPEKLGYRLIEIAKRPPLCPGETEDHMIWTSETSWGTRSGWDRPAREG